MDLIAVTEQKRREGVVMIDDARRQLILDPSPPGNSIVTLSPFVRRRPIMISGGRERANAVSAITEESAANE
jgi:hypothetical protein